MPLEHSTPRAARATGIPGLTLFDVPVHGQDRQWFTESWPRQKLARSGFPKLGPVRNEVSITAARGVTHGIHAESKDRYVSVAAGSVFGAWVDLRQGNTFGTVFTAVIDPGTVVFVPRGVGNAFQSLQDDTVYACLVDHHGPAGAQHQHTVLNPADETVAIGWPIALQEAELTAHDRAHPRLAEVVPMAPPTVIILGAAGQLGRELARHLAGGPGVEVLGRTRYDLADPAAVETIDWCRVTTVINAAAYTAVEEAETFEGGRAAWAANAEGVARLASVCAQHNVTLIHISTDHVFDGAKDGAYTEADVLHPVNAYGISKAAGDLAVGVTPKHYLLRTSRVIGDGPNFVRTMWSLAARGVRPTAVADQVGRLTFTQDLVAAIVHLRSSGAPYGTYNVTGAGEPGSWADVARRVYESAGRPGHEVTEMTTEQCIAGTHCARRPRNTVLDLAKLQATGFTPRDQWQALDAYLADAYGVDAAEAGAARPPTPATPTPVDRGPVDRGAGR